ncbi:DMT family transporter [Gemella sp. zg-570]|nr:DMT family transporter [Gemella sp. zg-1178]QWQ39550.1 DMT family transporter [Gemella sp. zg-570]
MGIICILISALGFALMSFFVKLSGDLPVTQKAFFRNLIAVLIAFLPIIKKHNSIVYPKGKKSWLVLFLRASTGTIGLLCNFYAVSHLHLADASVIQRLSPFVIIILSYFIFKENVSLLQMTTISLAFIGVVLVIKPSFENFMSLGALAGLGTAFFSGFAYTCVRYLGKKNISAEFIILFFSVFSCLATFPFMLVNFKEMSYYQIMILLFVGITGAIGQFGVTYAYKYSSANKISIFDYTQIIFSGTLGFIFFNEIPDFLSLLGYLIIIAMGFILTFYKR